MDRYSDKKGSDEDKDFTINSDTLEETSSFFEVQDQNL